MGAAPLPNVGASRRGFLNFPLTRFISNVPDFAVLPGRPKSASSFEHLLSGRLERSSSTVAEICLYDTPTCVDIHRHRALVGGMGGRVSLVTLDVAPIDSAHSLAAAVPTLKVFEMQRPLYSDRPHGMVRAVQHESRVSFVSFVDPRTFLVGEDSGLLTLYSLSGVSDEPIAQRRFKLPGRILSARRFTSGGSLEDSFLVLSVTGSFGGYREAHLSRVPVHSAEVQHLSDFFRTESLWSADISPRLDRIALVAGSRFQLLRLRLTDPTPTLEVERDWGPRGGSADSIRFAHNGDTVVTVENRREVFCHPSDSPRIDPPFIRFDVGFSTRGAALTPGGQRLATAAENGELLILGPALHDSEAHGSTDDSAGKQPATTG